MNTNEKENPRRPTTALVLETNNLRGGEEPEGGASRGAREEQVVGSLLRLLERLRAQTRPLTSLDEIVITHDGLSRSHCDRLEAAAGAKVRFVAIAPEAGYYEAKNRGFEATTADVVAFGDADCWPDPGWLEHLLAPFSDERVRVVAGRTTYRDDLLGIAATAIDFMYFPSPLGEGCVRNFYANNVAFRREVFAGLRYLQAESIYRGHCQILGLRLATERIPVTFAPKARTVHKLPDTALDLCRLRLLRGADTVEMTPRLADALLPQPWRWLGRLGPASPLGVLAIRLGASLRAVGLQEMSEVHGARRALCLLSVGGISAADAAGALGKSVLGLDFGARDGGLVQGALAYHGP